MDGSRHQRPARVRVLSWRSVTSAVVLAAAAGSFVAVAATGALTPRAAKNVVISTRSNAKYGTILVSGTTLYTLKADATLCGASCVKYWPPVLLARGARAVTGSGVKASALGAIALRNGTRQVTYGGKALYRFALDKKPGQVKGEVTDTWGTWSVVVVLAHTSGSGETSTTTPKSPTTTSPTTTVPKTTTTQPSSGGGGGGGGGVAF